MIRADDLQAEWNARNREPVSPTVGDPLVAAIPDLLAVVRAAQAHLSASSHPHTSVDDLMAAEHALGSTLVAFEEGGKP